MRWRVLAVCAALGALIAGGPAVLAQRGVSGTAAGEGGRKWAVVIGVGAYSDPALSDLPNAVRDARAVYDALVSGGGLFAADNVILLTDDAPNPLHTPTRSNILGILAGWVEQAGSEDSLLVYFAGHGVDADGRLYLMPQDAPSNNAGLTGIAYSDFEAQLERSSARLSLVILDACHAGVGRGQAGMTRGMAAELDAYSEGRTLLSSCKKDEVSHEMEGQGHGAFTWYLLEGLGSGADANGDAAVSAKELSEYTFEQVSGWSRRNQSRQTPRLKADIPGDFVLAQVRAVQGRPRPPVANEVMPPAGAPEPTGPQAGRARTVDLGNGVRLELVWIPPGEFVMGSPEGEEGRFDDECPQHRVRISRGFWMGKYEVTQGQWEAVMGSNPSHFTGDALLPVEQVSWEDCQSFLQALNGSLSGVRFRLPTEAEWEYACRAGATTRFCFGDDQGWLGEYAWYRGNSDGRTRRVGGKKPNAWGLYDMHGNVWEWCEDDWHDNYDGAPSDGSAWVDRPRGSVHAPRGGSWFIYPWYCRSALRSGGAPEIRNDCLGFRVVLPAVQ